MFDDLLGPEHLMVFGCFFSRLRFLPFSHKGGQPLYSPKLPEPGLWRNNHESLPYPEVG